MSTIPSGQIPKGVFPSLSTVTSQRNKSRSLPTSCHRRDPASVGVLAMLRSVLAPVINSPIHQNTLQLLAMGGLTRYPESPHVLSRDISLISHRIIVASLTEFAFAFALIGYPNSLFRSSHTLNMFGALTSFCAPSLFFPPFFHARCRTPESIAHTWPKYTHMHVLGEHDWTPLQRPADPPSASLGTLSVGIKNLAPENVQQPHPSTSLEFRTRHVKHLVRPPYPFLLASDQQTGKS
ncbi:hypothetical protein GGI35DRAFT_106991 [Trichoderma velutinum]